MAIPFFFIMIVYLWFAEVGFHFGISSLLAICTATEYMTLTRDKEPLTSQFSSYSSQGW